MSKAFTRESDEDLPELPALRPASDSLPPGVPNYLTPDGAERFRQDLDRAINEERPQLMGSVRSGGDKKPLQQIDQRIRFLERILETAAIVAPSNSGEPRTRFGSSVTVVDAEGAEDTYRLVGVDETDIDQGWISWRSPLAQALMNSQAGDRLQVKLPAGVRELRIVSVRPA